VNEGLGPSHCHAELTVTILQPFTSDLLNTLTTAPMLQSRSERVNKLSLIFGLSHSILKHNKRMIKEKRNSKLSLEGFYHDRVS